MNIALEHPATNHVASYTETTVTIDSIVHQTSLIISQERIDSNLTITALQNIDDTYVALLLAHEPEVVLLGSAQGVALLDYAPLTALYSKRIGVECMSVGAASRTYNLLLNEGRRVVVGFILAA